jgi:hypothetical protein
MLAMAQLPSAINGVEVEYSATVNKTVEQRLIDGLQACIRHDIASGHTLATIYISSANDSHSLPSRHAQAKAVDISRINGKKMAIHYGEDAAVTAIVEAIQNAFEGYVHRRENFGPFIKRKLGATFSVSGHADHIHLSVS